MKKIILFILATVLLLPILLIYSSSDDNTVNLYDVSAKKKQTKVDKSFSIQFNAKNDFNAIELFIANTSAGKNTDFKLSLYKWDNNYQTSLSNAPIISREISTVLERNKWFTWNVEAVAGEYIVHIEEPDSGSLTVNITETTYDKVRLYESHLSRGGNIEMRIKYVSKNDGLGDISANNQFVFEDFDRLAAIDGLQRELPGYEEAGPVRENKYVGIFFHTWHDWDASRGSRNVTEILKEHPDIVNDWKSKHWGNAPVYHWNEPVYNYYKNTDRLGS